MVRAVRQKAVETAAEVPSISSEWASIVRQARTILGMKQAAFSEHLRVDQATISRWERGLSNPSLAVQSMLRDIIARPIQDRILFTSVEHSLRDRQIIGFDGIPLEVSRGLLDLHRKSRDVLIEGSRTPYFQGKWEWYRDLLSWKVPVFSSDLAFLSTRTEVGTPGKDGGAPVIGYAIAEATSHLLADGRRVLLIEKTMIDKETYDSLPEKPTVITMDEVMKG